MCENVDNDNDKMAFYCEIERVSIDGMHNLWIKLSDCFDFTFKDAQVRADGILLGNERPRPPGSHGK